MTYTAETATTGRATSQPSSKMLAYRYRRGATYRQLAAEYDLDESVVRRRTRDLVESRRTGPPATPVTDEEIVRLRDVEHLPWRALAEHVGMSSPGVRRRYSIATTGVEPWRQARGRKTKPGGTNESAQGAMST